MSKPVGQQEVELSNWSSQSSSGINPDSFNVSNKTSSGSSSKIEEVARNSISQKSASALLLEGNGKYSDSVSEADITHDSRVGKTPPPFQRQSSIAKDINKEVGNVGKKLSMEIGPIEGNDKPSIETEVKEKIQKPGVLQKIAGFIKNHKKMIFTAFCITALVCLFVFGLASGSLPAMIASICLIHAMGYLFTAGMVAMSLEPQEPPPSENSKPDDKSTSESKPVSIDLSEVDNKKNKTFDNCFKGIFNELSGNLIDVRERNNHKPWKNSTLFERSEFYKDLKARLEKEYKNNYDLKQDEIKQEIIKEMEKNKIYASLPPELEK